MTEMDLLSRSIWRTGEVIEVMSIARQPTSLDQIRYHFYSHCAPSEEPNVPEQLAKRVNNPA